MATATFDYPSASVSISSSFPDSNKGMGLGYALYVGDPYNASAAERRSLLSYDVASLAGKTITGVTVLLNETDAMDTESLGSWPVFFRRLLRPWSEATVTWNKYDGTNPWGTAGGGSDGVDRVATDSVSVTFDGTPALGQVAFSAPEMIADVQAWVDGTAENYGWLIQGPPAQSGAGRVYNKFLAEGGVYHQLIVEYVDTPLSAYIDGTVGAKDGTLISIDGSLTSGIPMAALSIGVPVYLRAADGWRTNASVVIAAPNTDYEVAVESVSTPVVSTPIGRAFRGWVSGVAARIRAFAGWGGSTTATAGLTWGATASVGVVTDVNTRVWIRQVRRNAAPVGLLVGYDGLLIENVPPSQVTGLAATTESSQTVLTWDAATDNVAVVGYDIYKDGVYLAAVAGLTYTATGLTNGTAYSFTVRAKDAAGNVGLASDPHIVTPTSDVVATRLYATSWGVLLANDTSPQTSLGGSGSVSYNVAIAVVSAGGVATNIVEPMGIPTTWYVPGTYSGNLDIDIPEVTLAVGERLRFIFSVNPGGSFSPQTAVLDVPMSIPAQTAVLTYAWSATMASSNLYFGAAGTYLDFFAG